MPQLLISSALCAGVLAAGLALGIPAVNAADDPSDWRRAGLSALLRESDNRIVMEALSVLPAHIWRAGDETVLPVLVGALSHESWEVRQRAAQALGELGSAVADAEAISALLLAVADPDEDVRRAAREALNRIGSASAVPVLVDALSHESWEVRIAAAGMLIRTDRAAAAPAVPVLVGALSHESWEVRQRAAQALGELGSATGDARAISALVAATVDPDEDVRKAAREAISKLSQNVAGPSHSISLALLDLAERFPSKASESRIWARFFSGDSDPLQTLVDWLGRPGLQPIDGLKDNPAQVNATLYAFADALPVIERDGDLSLKTAEAVIRVASEGRGNFAIEDILLLRRLVDALDDHGRGAQSREILTIADDLQPNKLARATLMVGAGHVILWSLLVFAYPYSRPVQTFFFWNKWVRWFVGIGYVPLLLAWVPFLRRRLFKPFHTPLLADAQLGDFDPSAYFAGSCLRVGHRPEPLDLVEEIPEVHGQTVLEGESGLGKTMFIRYLLTKSPRIVVYLPATKCANGVLAAIQAKLEGPARDPDFLQSLVFAGAIDVIIDGLNEVSADVHARIVEFADAHFAGNLLISTQPMEWTPPTNARTCVLEPLSEAQIRAFLVSRSPNLPEDATITGENYEKAAEHYIKQVLAETETEARSAAHRALSNPMDLTVISDMLARGETPNLLDLRLQQYSVMSEDYKRRQNGVAFPLEAFSERVFELRVKDQEHFDSGEFIDELLRMEYHRMVVARPGRSPDGDPIVAMHFRHDKIMDFFLYLAFIGDHQSRQIEYLRDARFRGVYLLLATHLPYEGAMTLREILIKQAAETRDHSLSDQFVLLLDLRKDPSPPSDT